MKLIEKVSKNEMKFQRMIGLRLKQFNQLVQSIIPLWNEAEKKRLTNSSE